MSKALYSKRMDYYRNLRKINDNEIYLNEMLNLETEDNILDIKPNFELLNEKEKKLIDLLYNKGLSYKEISIITCEKIETIRKRRNRAVAKLKELWGKELWIL